MHHRSTVEACLALLALPEEERRREVTRLDTNVNVCRQATYTFHACSTPKCVGKIHAVRAMANRPDLCTPCWLKFVSLPNAVR